jgi:glycosyltransferase involved in cell wall biosynthesis
MAEIIVKTGLLVSPDEEDTDTLASAIKTLLANPSLRQEWGHAARQRVEERLT